ncbi:hypothetical protein Moror_6527 [Moniliophthora roreri MCA 2997]|uniref:Uncharacterized protein n=1 Tax=Moniliophthora roreri (strain MCA 2997) TaxID=1381753 RepID=V2YZ10_MONRO|nr:hypothetical protein Moror_6527 [Moniliophthora roreri MCA 2997]
MAAALARRAVCQRKLYLEPLKILNFSNSRNFSRLTHPLLQQLQSTTTNPWSSIDKATQEATGAIRKLVETRTRDESPEAVWKRMSATAHEELQKNPPNHSYIGRSVRVVDGNVQDAFSRLKRLLNRNAVRLTWRADERHERKGEKRRRLRSIRWRRIFAHHVRKSVQLVTKIRTRGA